MYVSTRVKSQIQNICLVWCADIFLPIFNIQRWHLRFSDFLIKFWYVHAITHYMHHKENSSCFVLLINFIVIVLIIILMVVWSSSTYLPSLMAIASSSLCFSCENYAWQKINKCLKVKPVTWKSASCLGILTTFTVGGNTLGPSFLSFLEDVIIGAVFLWLRRTNEKPHIIILRCISTRSTYEG